MFLTILSTIWILDRHQVWWSHDPTSVQTFDFCEEKKRIHTPFFHFAFLVQILAKLNSTSLTWVNLGYQRLPQVPKGTISFYSHLPNYLLSCLPGYPNGYPPGYLPSYPHRFWCFPIWLTTTLSYLMAIFSANEIRTFFE